jgi:hypothetical protein
MRRYIPANGTEGDAFEEKWCRRCACDDEAAVLDGESDGCPILATALAGPQGPSQWIQDVEGGPKCTAFIQRRADGEQLDPFQAERDLARYNALPRDPISGRPIIA